MDLAKTGEELEYSSDSDYEQAAPDHHRWHAEWREFERTAFLRRLSDLIAKPVMRENETSKYLSTQSVAELLAHLYGTHLILRSPHTADIIREACRAPGPHT